MAETQQALIASLRADISGFRRDLQQATRVAQDFGQRAGKSLDNLDKSNKRVAASTQSMAGGFRSLRNVLIGLGLGAVARQSLTLGTQLISVDRTLRATTGSAKAAGEAYAFVRQQSLRLGTDIISGARAFAQMTENTRGTRLEGLGAKTIFEGLGTTVTALGLNTDQYRRALIAANQVLTQNRIKTEELNQFAEAGIPIFRELSQSLGISGSELRKALEQGQIPADALLLVMGRLKDRFAEVANEASQSTPIAFAALISVLQETSGQFGVGALASTRLNESIRALSKSTSELASPETLQNTTTFVDQLVSLGTGTLGIFDKISNAVTKFKESLNFTSVRAELVELQTNAAQKFIDDLGLTQKAAESLAQVIFGVNLENEKLVLGFTDQLENVNNVIDSIIGRNEQLNDVFRNLNKSSSFITDDFEEAVESSTDRVRKEYEELATFIRDAIKNSGADKELEKQAEKEAKTRIDIFKKSIAQQEKLEEERLEALGEIRRKANEEQADLEIRRATAKFRDLGEVELREFINAQRKLIELRQKLLAAGGSDRSESEIAKEEQLQADRLRIVEQAEAELTRRQFRIIDARTQRAIKEAKDLAEAIQRPFERAAQNVQDALADSITNALSGQLDDVGDIADEIVNIFHRAAAEFTTAFFIQPAFENLANSFRDSFTGAVDDSKESVESLGDEVKKTTEELKKTESSGRNAAFALGGVLVASHLLRGQGIPSVVNDIVGGATTGAALGFQAGGPVGAAGGAAIGGLAGSGFFELLRDFNIGLFGGGTTGRIAAGAIDPVQGLQDLIGVLSGGPKQSRFAVQTTAAPPTTRPSDDALVRGAFGFISLIDEQSKRANAAEVSGVIAELDRTIASAITERQRRIVAASLQNPVSGVIVGEANAETDQALSEVIVQRLRTIVGTLAGGEVAANVVPTTAGDQSAAGVQALQRRVNDALAILRTIDEIEQGPQTQSAEAIARLKDEFGAMITRAEEFGIATGALSGELARQIAQIGEAIDKNVEQRILEIEDPAEAARAALRERQRIEIEEARDANANLIRIERLHVLEREQLAQQLADANAGIDAESASLFDRVLNIIQGGGNQDPRAEIESFFTSFIDSARDISQAQLAHEALREEYARLRTSALLLGRSTADLEQAFRDRQRQINAAALAEQQAQEQTFQSFVRAGRDLSPVDRQIEQLGLNFRRLLTDAQELGRGTSDLTRSFEQQVARIREAAREQERAQRQQAEGGFQEFVASAQDVSETGRALAQLQIRFQNLLGEALDLGRQTNDLFSSFASLGNALRREARQSALNTLEDLINPFAAARREVANQLDQFAQLLSEGLIDSGLFRRLEAQSKAAFAAQEALQLISGGNRSPIQDIADAFSTFVGAGNPLSAAGQELFNLTETFLNLRDAAELLGFATFDLESSYEAQAKVIRERLIEDIDRQLSSQIQGIESINRLIGSFRTAPEQPGTVRLSAAEEQFQAAITSGNIQDILAAATQFRDIGRGQFGSGSGFFDIENRIEAALIGVRDQQQQAVEDERRRLEAQARREERQLLLGENSLQSLLRVEGFGEDAAEGIDALIRLGIQQAQRSQQLQNLLENLLGRQVV